MYSATSDLRANPPTRFIIWLPLVFVVSGLLLRLLAIRTAMPDSALSDYFQTLCRWDCSWYVRLAETGYDPFPVPARVPAGNWAFFPFYPMLVGVIRWVIPLPTIALASIISIVTAYTAVIVAWPLLGANKRAYTLYAAFVLSGPVSIYFTSFFTEVMYLLLVTLAFRLLSHSNYLAAGIAAALLSATRIVGVFITVSIGLQAVLDHFRNGGTWRNLLPTLLGNPQLVLAIFIAPFGLFAYMAFLHHWIGDGLAFSHVQRAWGRVIDNPLIYLWRGLNTTPAEGFAPTGSQILAISGLAGLVLTAVLAWRRQWPAVVFCLLAIFVPLAAGLASMLRFMAAMAPLTITLMTMLAARNWLFWLSLGLLLIGSFTTTLAWLGGNVALA